jgi:hypothetical protein
MIRYGGIYARHRAIDKKLNRAISKEKHLMFQSFNKWRSAILFSFGYDPLECPDCKHKMVFLELYYNHQRMGIKKKVSFNLLISIYKHFYIHQFFCIFKENPLNFIRIPRQIFWN